MTRVLVVHASKMGSTASIGEAIGEQLALRGLRVEVRSVEEVSSLDGCDAVVLGSAVYYGRWRRQAIRFVKHFNADLKRRSVWMFESGWVGKRPSQVEPTPMASRWARRIGAESVAVFGGRLDSALAKTYPDRLLARYLASDSRDWQNIRDWAATIADGLTTDPDTR